MREKFSTPLKAPLKCCWGRDLTWAGDLNDPGKFKTQDMLTDYEDET